MPLRVVSLVPSTTETLRAWGHDPIACTKYCEQPDVVAVGGTKNPDIAAIVALRPDVVMMDVEENRSEDAAALRAAGIEVFATDVRSLDDVGVELGRMATRIGVDPPSVEWSDRVSALTTEFAPGGCAETAATTVFVPIWRRPWMTIGGDTYGSTLLGALGFRSVYDDRVLYERVYDDRLTDTNTATGAAAARYPIVELGDVAARSPDLVLAPSEPYVFEAAHLAELAEVAPVIEVDGQDLFWWGARTPAAIERLSATLAPHGR